MSKLIKGNDQREKHLILRRIKINHEKHNFFYYL